MEAEGDTPKERESWRTAAGGRERERERGSVSERASKTAMEKEGESDRARKGEGGKKEERSRILRPERWLAPARLAGNALARNAFGEPV